MNKYFISFVIGNGLNISFKNTIVHTSFNLDDPDDLQTFLNDPTVILPNANKPVVLLNWKGLD